MFWTFLFFKILCSGTLFREIDISITDHVKVFLDSFVSAPSNLANVEMIDLNFKVSQMLDLTS